MSLVTPLMLMLASYLTICILIYKRLRSQEFGAERGGQKLEKLSHCTYINSRSPGNQLTYRAFQASENLRSRRNATAIWSISVQSDPDDNCRVQKVWMIFKIQLPGNKKSYKLDTLILAKLYQ